MSSSAYINMQVESVSVTGEHTDGTFDVSVMSKSGISATYRLSRTDIIREYGAYLTATDRLRLTPGSKCIQKHKHKFCAIM
jgi:hypothetical protein